MKKYATPTMEMMDYIVDKNIAGLAASSGENNEFNDGQFGSWGD